MRISTKVIYYWAKLLRRLSGKAIYESEIHQTSTIEPGSHVVHSRMDRHSFCGYGCEIIMADIGSFCSIANGVVIGGGMHPWSWVSTSPVFYAGRDSVGAKFSTHARQPMKKTTVGHDVWIGRNAIIKQGVELGTGSVIGMGSIVTKNVPPYAIVGGNPAKLIRYRFDESVIDGLIRSKWWTFSDDQLLKYAQHFTCPENFLKAIEQ